MVSTMGNATVVPKVSLMVFEMVSWTESSKVHEMASLKVCDQACSMGFVTACSMA